MGLDAAIAGARLLEVAGGAVLFGAALLLLLAATPPASSPWSRPFLGGSALIVAAGSALALGLQTVGMAGSLRDGLAPAALLEVVRDTGFGRSVLVRVLAAAGAAALTLGPRGDARRLPWVAGLGGVALASLAWSGHGAADAGVRGWVHLGGDLAHLLAAGAWLGALATLALLALRSRGSPERDEAFGSALNAFSGMGVAVVAVLLLSGLSNAGFLVGPSHWRTLASDPWGWLLLLKLGLFAVMLALAALNRWRWAPALGRGGSVTDALRRSVAAEAALGLGVLAAAAVMGGLAPPAAQG